MEDKNATLEFILLGFYEWPHLHLTLFVIFLLVYLMALTCNITIIVLILCDSNLHNPMYFFLCNLSIVDIALASIIMPKLLDICLTENQSITFLGCFTQVFFFIICAIVEYLVLAVMAYDRYVAICFPLRYSTLMSFRICLYLALMAWGLGFLDSLMLTGMISRRSFTKYNKVNHLFCDLKPLLKMSNSSTREAEITLLMSGFIYGVVPLVFILVTYIFIIYNILKIRSTEGKRKAFSTCSSHLTVITLFLVIIISMFMRPNTNSLAKTEKILTFLYASCIPTLNPVIYSLRNKDIHAAIQKLRPALRRPFATQSKVF